MNRQELLAIVVSMAIALAVLAGIWAAADFMVGRDHTLKTSTFLTKAE